MPWIRSSPRSSMSCSRSPSVVVASRSSLAARSSLPGSLGPLRQRAYDRATAGERARWLLRLDPAGARDPEAGRRLVAALHPGGRRGVSRWASGWPSLHPRPALGRRPGAVRDRGATPARPRGRDRGRRGLSGRRARGARARGRAHGSTAAGRPGRAARGHTASHRRPRRPPRRAVRPAAARRDGGLGDRGPAAAHRAGRACRGPCRAGVSCSSTPRSTGHRARCPRRGRR